MRIPETKYTVSDIGGGACLLDHDAAVNGEAPIRVAEVSGDGAITVLSALTRQDVKGVLFRGMRDDVLPAGRWSIGVLRAVGIDALPSWFLSEHLATRAQATRAQATRAQS